MIPIDRLFMRRLANKKSSRVGKGRGIPKPNEGNDGDMKLHQTDTGMKLFAKMNNQWFGFTPDATGGTSETSSLTTQIEQDGYETLSSGLIIQWGTIDTGAQTDTEIFPIPFPNNIFVVLVGLTQNTNDTKYTAKLKSKTTTQFVWYAGHAYAAGMDIDWIAIGN